VNGAIRFRCRRGCTNCCDQPGFVYLTEDDLGRAARFLGLSAAEFEARYVYRTARRRRLRKPKNKQCPFLESGGCAIHPAKPTQCQTFPFWPELVESRQQWARTAQYCPGIGQGPLIQIGDALERAEQQRRAYPEDY
jgi:Fe-S-cluster containining protein